MPKLHFGVVDHPYTYKQQTLSKKGKPLKRTRTVTLNTTTGKVSDILEEKYQLFETFYKDNESLIASELEKSLEAAYEAVLTGAPVSQDPYGNATGRFEDLFKRALYTNGFDGRIPGVPTVASGRVPAVRKGGIQHRMAHPYSMNNPSRPSFIDTGNFESSIKVWVEE